MGVGWINSGSNTTNKGIIFPSHFLLRLLLYYAFHAPSGGPGKASDPITTCVTLSQRGPNQGLEPGLERSKSTTLIKAALLWEPGPGNEFSSLVTRTWVFLIRWITHCWWTPSKYHSDPTNELICTSCYTGSTERIPWSLLVFLPGKS